MTAVRNWTREDQAAEDARHAGEQWPPGNGWPRAEVPCPATHPEHETPCICVAHTEGDHRDEHGCTWPNQASPEQQAAWVAEADARQIEWQLDALRARRNERLAKNERQRAEIEDDYNRAIAALSTNRTQVGA